MALKQLAQAIMDGMAHVGDRTIPGPAGDIPARICRPAAAEPLGWDFP